MKILIFASIGAQNLGDELILKNEIKILQEKYKSKNPRFVVFSYDYKNPFLKEKNIIYKEYFPISIKNPKNIFKNIKNFFIFLKETINSDLIVIGGGGLFFDNESGNKKNSLNLWIFRKKIFDFFKKKIYFFRIGINISNNNSKKQIKEIFSGKNIKVETRDSYSFNLLKELKINNLSQQYDPVFLDNSGNIENILRKKISIKKIFNNFNTKDLEDINFKNKNVGIAFRRGYLSKNYELEILMIREIINYIQKKGGKIILLPHSFSKKDILSNDYNWKKIIIGKLKNIKITKNLEETYSFYKEKNLNIILAQRLHSIILSQVYEIPFIGISYSQKTTEILNMLK